MSTILQIKNVTKKYGGSEPTDNLAAHARNKW